MKIILADLLKPVLDINECLSYPCDHECENIDGNFICKCSDGYELLNGTMCSAKGKLCILIDITSCYVKFLH